MPKGKKKKEVAAERKVRVVFVGAGQMANHVHYPSLASLPDVDLAAVCDLDEARLNATADRWGIGRRYTDYRKMVEDLDPDAIYVIGQPHLMYDIWVWCLQRGLNLYIEKPMGLTMHQARMLAHLAEKHDCITQVSFQRRASPLANLLRDACLRRGAMTHAVCEFYKRQNEPMLGARDQMLDNSVHAVDTLRWMCGGEAKRVESVSKSVGVPDLNVSIALAEFDSGATGVLLTNYMSGRRIFRIGMHAPGVAAEADLETGGRLYLDGDTEGVEHAARQVAGSDELYVFGGFQAKNREFIESVRTGKQPSSHFGDAIKTMELAERILAQALLGDG